MCNESLDAAPQQIGQGMGRRPVSHPLFHARHQDFVLLFSQFEQNLLSFQKVGHALSGDLAENRRRRVLGVRQLLPYGVHHAGILPHGKIDQDPLGCEQGLHALAAPSPKAGRPSTILWNEWIHALLPLP